MEGKVWMAGEVTKGGMMATYIWGDGFHSLIDPAVFAERYEYLRRRYQEVTPSVVVADAAPEDSPTHVAFEWDDARAAHAHRLGQARIMLASIRVIHEEGERAVPVRFLISIKATDAGVTGRNRQYVPLSEALADPERREEVLWRIVAELEAFQRKYAEVSELSDVFDASTRLIAEVRAASATPLP
jgi:hypothetical protein